MLVVIWLELCTSPLPKSQHFRRSCFRHCGPNSLEFSAWQFAWSSCWAWSVSTWLENASEWHCISFSALALAVFSRNALYKLAFYLLTFTYISVICCSNIHAWPLKQELWSGLAHKDIYYCVYVCVCMMIGQHQKLQTEVARLNERETAMQTENQRLQQSIILLEKVSSKPCSFFLCFKCLTLYTLLMSYGR